MSNEFIYVPVLKGKAGEFQALRDLDIETKEVIRPLIEIPPIPWDFIRDCPAKTIDDHVAKISENLNLVWGSERPIFVDPLYIENEGLLDGDENPLKRICDEAFDIGVSIIPVANINMPQHYKNSIREIANENQAGVCFRFGTDDLDDENFEDGIDELLEDFGVAPESVDFILDLSAINPDSIGIHVRAARSFINELSYCNEWRSFILTSSSFPQTLSNLERNSISRIRRAEWDLWSRIANRPERVSRVPTYGDFTVVHPEPFEMDPRMMQLGAKIKYAQEDEWLIVKGQGIRRGGADQTHDLCRWLVGLPEYLGREFSWADDTIFRCSENETGPGNQTTWVRVGVNHHITYVVDQLSRFFAA